jgi:hypothetical protein
MLAARERKEHKENFGSRGRSPHQIFSDSAFFMFPGGKRKTGEPSLAARWFQI